MRRPYLLEKDSVTYNLAPPIIGYVILGKSFKLSAPISSFVVVMIIVLTSWGLRGIKLDDHSNGACKWYINICQIHKVG